MWAVWNFDQISAQCAARESSQFTDTLNFQAQFESPYIQFELSIVIPTMIKGDFYDSCTPELE